MVIDALGHGFYVALVAGQLAITRRRAWGWALRLAGSLGWAVLGVDLGLSSVVLWSLIFAVVDARGWWAWRSES